MTEPYIEYKLKSTSDAARDFLAWNSIRAESRLRNSPHLRLQREFNKKVMDTYIECRDFNPAI